MNPAVIAKLVGDIVHDATEIRTREVGDGAHALVCERGGRLKSVMFDATGLYPNSNTHAASDLWLAAEIAKELKK